MKLFEYKVYIGALGGLVRGRVYGRGHGDVRSHIKRLYKLQSTVGYLRSIVELPMKPRG